MCVEGRGTETKKRKVEKKNVLPLAAKKKKKKLPFQIAPVSHESTASVAITAPIHKK